MTRGKRGDLFVYKSEIFHIFSYDNILEMDHDAEDKYFDSEDPEEIRDETSNTRESSEDELDIYMNALNQHPAVCELARNISDRLWNIFFF